MHARVVMTKAGGTLSPRDFIWATDHALPPTRSRLGSLPPSKRRIHLRAFIGSIRSFDSFAANQAKQVLMEFKPDCVIAFDSGAAHPLDLAILGPIECLA